MSRQTVNALENGRYDPSLPLAFRIAALFDLRIEQIFDQTSRRWGLPELSGVCISFVASDKRHAALPISFANGRGTRASRSTANENSQ